MSPNSLLVNNNNDEFSRLLVKEVILQPDDRKAGLLRPPAESKVERKQLHRLCPGTLGRNLPTCTQLAPKNGHQKRLSKDWILKGSHAVSVLAGPKPRRPSSACPPPCATGMPFCQHDCPVSLASQYGIPQLPSEHQERNKRENVCSLLQEPSDSFPVAPSTKYFVHSQNPVSGRLLTHPIWESFPTHTDPILHFILPIL